MEIKRTGTDRDKDDVGSAYGFAGCHVGIGRGVDHNHLGAGCYGSLDGFRQTARRRGDDLGRLAVTPVTPGRSGCLRVQIDDDRDIAGGMGRFGKVDGQRRLADATLLTDDGQC
jgi:hypothetical protein